MLFAQSALSGFGEFARSRPNAVLGLLFLIGWAASLVALRRARATGRGAAGAALFVAQAAGLTLAAMQQIQDFLYPGAPPQTTFYAVCDAAWPLSVLAMIVTGIFAAVAHVMKGWRRWTPLLCGLALPVLFSTMAVLGQQRAALVFGLYAWAAWALMAAALLGPEHAS